ncbi:MAG: amino acid--tRNA ligase-related protein [bacterium]|nr:amino acid--tRNA ligase-related protein [bacterium]
MINNYRGHDNSKAFNEVVQALRTFFLSKGFMEVHTQDRLSILAACEDPTTVATYTYAGEIWPLPQTGQMWLEYELLTQPKLAGVFCVSTSYRAEPNPVPGRHKIIFPMFEFEAPGTVTELEALERELCEYLGFGDAKEMKALTYDEVAGHYGVQELGHEHERALNEDFTKAVLLTRFPQYTSPFWNMKKDGEYAEKIDVILGGAETIGSAERSSDPEEMREQFHVISDGQYAQLLYNLFGKERVEKELEAFLSLTFFSRFGGGIGITRMIDALQKNSNTAVVSPVGAGQPLVCSK